MADELLQNYTPSIETLTFIPSGQGRFEVMVDDDLIFSKKALGRHAESGEVAKLFEETTNVQPMPRE